MRRWTACRQISSSMQDWGIFTVDGDPKRPEIQRVDENPTFDSDLDARTYVRMQALLGDKMALAAEEIVKK